MTMIASLAGAMRACTIRLATRPQTALRPISGFNQLAPLANGATKRSMAFERRPSCYKCGELGHLADNCVSPQRLCYNCKQPGHESSECPIPRSTKERQCYRCKGFGHLRAECPDRPTLDPSGISGDTLPTA